MLWKPPEMWKNGECWIIGGGSSIIEEFQIPQSVVNDVMRGQKHISTYSPYFSALHKKHVIGINAAYKLGNWLDIIFFGDPQFWKDHRDYLLLYPSLKVTCADVGDKWKGIKWMRPDTRKKVGINAKKGFVSWNRNSGSAALSLAVQLGVKRIILVGFDMRVNLNKQHWHNVYRKDGQAARKLPFVNHLKPFSIIAQDAKDLGVEIINASPNSAIDCFEKTKIKELL
ncbi:MAG: hypothetical protein ACOCUV_03540 [bacterium]